ncbi:unnamed protein product [Orchesella dallaii]|uniref:Gustatory receptor n=1 Tax=Orchesella dallaii TaxID=48710 RepID=A0ABP1Q6C6_9HEXA
MVWQENGDAYFEKLPKGARVVSGFLQFIRILEFTTITFGFYTKMGFYIENSLYFQFTFHCFWIFLTIGCSSFQYVFLGKTREVIDVVNQTIKLAKHMEQRFPLASQYEKNRRIRLLILAGFCGSYIFQNNVVIMPIFFKRYEEKWYFSAFILQPFYQHETTKKVAWVVGFLYELWWSSIQWGSILMLFYVQLLFVQTMITTLKGIRQYAKDVPFTSSEELIKILKVCSKLRILCSLFNNSIGNYYYPWLNALAGLVVVSGLVVLIKLFLLFDFTLIGLSIFSIITGLALVWAITRFCGMIQYESCKLYEELLCWKIGKKKATLELSAVRPIRVEVGDFYIIDRKTALTILLTISNAATSVLLSLNFDIST